MHKTIAGIIILGALLAGCATETPGPAATPTQVIVAPTASPVPPTEVPTATPTDAPISTPTATPTPEPTNTPTPIPTYTLSGTVFFDYNGNGLQDEGEPPIEGVPISVAGRSTTSGPDGSYSLAGVPAGNRQVYVESPTTEPATAFRYFSLSLEAFQSIDEPIRLSLDRHSTLDIGLMHGFLTLPFIVGQPYDVASWFDRDARDGFVRNWMGETAEVDHSEPCTRQRMPYGASARVFDCHYGIDYSVEVGALLVAPAPGEVVFVRVTDDEAIMSIRHAGAGVYTHYGHIAPGTEPVEGQVLARGQTTGRAALHYSPADVPYSGMLHVQIQLTRYISEEPTISEYWDPYRDVTDVHSVSYWSVDNNPQWAP